jgi:hypothetical protein
MLAIAAIAVGLTIGFAQWLVLRRALARAAFWIPATVAGWVMGTLLIDLLVQVGAIAGGAIVTGIILALTTALTTGACLGYLKQKSGEI